MPDLTHYYVNDSVKIKPIHAPLIRANSIADAVRLFATENPSHNRNFVYLSVDGSHWVKVFKAPRVGTPETKAEHKAHGDICAMVWSSLPHDYVPQQRAFLKRRLVAWPKTRSHRSIFHMPHVPAEHLETTHVQLRAVIEGVHDWASRIGLATGDPVLVEALNAEEGFLIAYCKYDGGRFAGQYWYESGPYDSAGRVNAVFNHLVESLVWP